MADALSQELIGNRTREVSKVQPATTLDPCNIQDCVGGGIWDPSDNRWEMLNMLFDIRKPIIWNRDNEVFGTNRFI